MSHLVLRYLELTRSVALGSGPWIAVNTILATIPAVLAVSLFHRDHKRTAGWWTCVAIFVLFLPNAPYVVTDVLHLRGMITGYPGSRASVVIPVGALVAMVVWGVAAYAVCLAEVDRILAHAGWNRWRLPIRSGLHLLCAFGVVLGRIPRLNSWHVFTRPTATADGILSVMEPKVLPLVVGLAIAFALGAAAVTAVGRTAGNRIHELAAAGRRFVDGPHLPAT